MVKVDEMDSDGFLLGRNAYHLLRGDEKWWIVEIVTNDNTMRLIQEPRKDLY